MRALLNLVRKKPLPARDPVQAHFPELQQASLSAVYYGQRMGGDLYDFLRVGPNRVLFGLLDVAGRAEENKGIVAAARDNFRSSGCELFSKEDVNEADAMMELCLRLNRTIIQSAGGVRSCAAFAGCYEENLGTVCYFNAGHTPGLVRDTTGVSELRATGLPLGLFSHTTCDASTVGLEPGATLLLVSRGIVEAKCNRQEFGLDSVKSNFQQSTHESAQELCLDVLQRVQDFMCVPPTHNDVTALALNRAAQPVGAEAASA